MDRVPAGLEDHIDHRAGGAPEFRGVAVGLHFELGNGVGRRRDHLRGERLRVIGALVIVHALEDEVILRLVVSVDHEPAEAARGTGEHGLRRAGHQQGEIRVSPGGQREIDGRAALHHLAERALFRLNDIGGSGHFHGGAHGGDLQAHAHQFVFVHIEQEIRYMSSLETGLFDVHDIAAVGYRSEAGVTVRFAGAR